MKAQVSLTEAVKVVHAELLDVRWVVYDLVYGPVQDPLEYFSRAFEKHGVRIVSGMVDRKQLRVFIKNMRDGIYRT